MTDYTVSSFVTDGSTPRSFDDLSLQNKVAIKALIALENLNDNLGNIATAQMVQNLGTDVGQLQQQNIQLQSQLDSLRAVLQQIDVLTDEVID
jgi:hypothetical protein|tara:strand:+ start:37 stop:315 length:279 start_codon:yes stop_codon:yes gene_type:complete